MSAKHENDRAVQKPIKQPHFSSYGREITLALLVKFLLLAGVWWLFFAGNKQPVNGAIIADKLFGESRPSIQTQKTQEHP